MLDQTVNSYLYIYSYFSFNYQIFLYLVLYLPRLYNSYDIGMDRFCFFVNMDKNLKTIVFVRDNIDCIN